MNYFFDNLPEDNRKEQTLAKLIKVLEENDEFYIVPDDICSEWIHRLEPLRVDDLDIKMNTITFHDYEIYPEEIYSASQMLYIQDTIQI